MGDTRINPTTLFHVEGTTEAAGREGPTSPWYPLGIQPTEGSAKTMFLICLKMNQWKGLRIVECFPDGTPIRTTFSAWQATPESIQEEERNGPPRQEE